MNEHLMDLREAADYLGIGEKKLKELVDAGEIPAYKIGGIFLRFRSAQLAVIKSAFEGEKPKPKERYIVPEGVAEKVKDFLYFNDFYILSILIIVVAVTLIVAT